MLESTHTVHDTRAIEAAREAAETPPPVARRALRQGDAVFRRIGGPRFAAGEPTPPAGVQVIAGRHGEHRVVTEAYRADTTGDVLELDLPRGALVVHTDAPAGRHCAARLAPGRWEVIRQRELDPDELVDRSVAD